MKRKCPHCGIVNWNDARPCIRCGADPNALPVMPAIYEEPVIIASIKPSAADPGRILLYIILGITALGGIYWYHYWSTYSDISDQYQKKEQDLKAEREYRRMTSTPVPIPISR